jgi:hypothetical protein
VVAFTGKFVRLLVKFALTFILLSFLCGIIWGRFVDGVLYNCTDELFGYFTPDNFVHEYAGMKVRVVAHVDPSDSMSAGDSIKEGWTIPRLWALWFAFLGTSLLLSGALALLPWRLHRPASPS